ncbi:MAG: sigma-70 family RNA polymerase sigma factor [Candidatus Zixiibacteriota bacterium]
MTKSIPELVDSFTQGDHKAFAELVNRFQRKIYSLAYRLLGDHLDADEVVQETFVRVYNRRKELQDVKYFSTFLLRIATNYAIDLLRKRRGHTSLLDETGSLPGRALLEMSRQVATPSQDYENKVLMEEIKGALDRLPPRQRLTAILHDIEGLSKSEIAAALGSPEATVRSNLHIARKKLKKILSQRLRGTAKE